MTTYNNYVIDTSPIYGNKVSINIEGDDILFETVEDAKNYIDNELQ